MRGRSRLYVSKDRHGEVRPHTQRVKGGKDWVGDLVVDSTSGVLTDVVLEPPTVALAEDGGPSTDLAEAVSAVLVKLDRPLTGKEIEDRVKGRAADIRAAVAWLQDEGYVQVEPGPRGAKLHSLITPYPASEEDCA